MGLLLHRAGLLMLLWACSGEPSGDAPARAPGDAPAEASEAPEAPEAPEAGDAADATMSPAHPGLLTEDGFKRLHQLTDAAAPPLLGEQITLPGGASAYLSLPPGAAAPVPAVVVIHEWWGLNAHIKHWSDRLAAAGYAALAVDLYGGQVATDPDRAMELMKQVDAARTMRHLQEATDFLGQDPRVRADRVGAIGWCFGGGWALRLAMARPDLDAAVIYYGRLVTDRQALAGIQAPLLAFFGSRDEGIPVERVRVFERLLGELDKDVQVHIFDAEHAFANPSGAHYAPQPAEEAWQRTRAFLEQHLQP